MQSTPRDVVAVAAYYHWLKAGQPYGRDQEFWLSAEAQLCKAATSQNTIKVQPTGTRQPAQRHEPVSSAPLPGSPKVNGRKARRRPVASL